MNLNIIYHQKGKDPLYKIWHASEQVMFIFIHSGTGSIICSEKTYSIQKGTLCLINSGKYHFTMPNIPEMYDRSKLLIKQEYFNKVCDFFPSNNLLQKYKNQSFVYAQIDECDLNAIEEIFSEIYTFSSLDKYSDAILFSSTIRLLVYLDKYSVEYTSVPFDFMSSALNYINQNILSDITIDNICSSIHMSKYYFCRQFKKYLGITVMDYILETRIVLAKNMLLKETVSITEISEKCGFSSVSYFCQVFKKMTGESPAKYRKRETHLT